MRTWNSSSAQKCNNPFVERTDKHDDDDDGDKRQKSAGEQKNLEFWRALSQQWQRAASDVDFSSWEDISRQFLTVNFVIQKSQVRTMHSIYMDEMVEHARNFIFIINPSKHNGIPIDKQKKK